MPKWIMQIYLWSFYRSYGKDSLHVITSLLPDLKKLGIWGIWLIGLWQDGGADNGFDVVKYDVNPLFGKSEELDQLIKKAHQLGLKIGADIVPHHTSVKSELAQKCFQGDPDYRDVLYQVTREEAAILTQNGVPSLFGQNAYSAVQTPSGSRFFRTTFADNQMFDLRWESPKVRATFAELIKNLKARGIDFLRVDCGMLLKEDVSKAEPGNPLAIFNPAQSVAAFQAVAGDMPLFYEWFDPSLAYLFENLERSWPVDCSFVMTGELDMTNWDIPGLIPLIGGHDQKTLADRNINLVSALGHMHGSEFAFVDLPSLVRWRTNPEPWPDDHLYDADLKNINQRYRGRLPIEGVLNLFLHREELITQLLQG